MSGFLKSLGAQKPNVDKTEVKNTVDKFSKYGPYATMEQLYQLKKTQQRSNN